MVASSPEPFAGAPSLPPGPPLPPFVQSAAFLVDPARFTEACRRALGDAYTLRLSGLPPMVVLSDPRALRDLLTGDPDVFHVGDANLVLKPATWLDSFGERSLFRLDGERHRTERAWMSAAFQPERLRAHERAMHEGAERGIAGWPIGEPIDVHRKMQELVLELLLSALFGSSADPSLLRDRVARMLGLGDRPAWLLMFGRHVERRMRALTKRSRGLSPWSELDDAVRALNATLEEEIERRRSTAAQGQDVLSILVAASGGEETPIDRAALMDELRTLLVAGHETTSRALSYAVFELLENPDVLERLREELDRGDDYLDATIREVLRLHPIVPLIARRLTAPANVGGRRFPRGTLLAGSVHLAHLDPASWPEPHRFRPERFLGTKIAPFEFLPFGQGKRRCLGMAFAQLEMRAVLRRIAAGPRLRFAMTTRPRRTSFAAPSGLRVVRDG